MPFDGNGNYAPPSPPDFPAVAGQRIMSARYNAVISDLAVALNNVLTRDSQAAPTANIDFGGFKGVNADDGTDPTDVATVGQMDAELDAIAAQLLAKPVIAVATDLNTVTTLGVYPITALLSCTNLPEVATVGYIPDNNNAVLLVLKGTGSDFVTQVLFGYTERRVYTRMYTTAWTAWEMVGRPGGTIASGIDFDLFRTPGEYSISDAAMAASTNRPGEVVGTSIVAAVLGGTLRIESWSASFVRQSFRQLNANKEFTRAWNGTVWSPWGVLYSTTHATWVPTLTAGASTFTYTHQSGYYWKVGPLVHFMGKVRVDVSSAALDPPRISLPIDAWVSPDFGINGAGTVFSLGHTGYQPWGVALLQNGNSDAGNFGIGLIDATSGSLDVPDFNVWGTGISEFTFSGWYIIGV